MCYNIGFDLGTLEDYFITKSAVKICILLDAFKPLIKEAVVNFSSREDLVVSLEYENLDLHCTEWNSLTHLVSSCPLSTTRLTLVQLTSRTSIPHPHKGYETNQDHYRRSSVQRSPAAKDTSFTKRFDRHGRPFGDRLPIKARRIPLRNKLTPKLHALCSIFFQGTTQGARPISHSPLLSQKWTTHDERLSPSYRPMLHLLSGNRTGRRGRVHTLSYSHTKRLRVMRSSHWTEEDPLCSGGKMTPSHNPRPETVPHYKCPSFTAYRETTFGKKSSHVWLSTASSNPNREEVLNELQEVTLQYTNCVDPTESAARRQWVLQGELHDLMVSNLFLLSSSISVTNLSS